MNERSWIDALVAGRSQDDIVSHTHRDEICHCTNVLMQYTGPSEIKNPILQVQNLGQNLEHRTFGHGPIIHHVNLNNVGA